MKKSLFITFEGSEGSGKSTQIELALRYLRSRKKKVVFLREPGGVKISESIRNILLDVKNKKMSDECEMLLYMAARGQLVKEKIMPALSEGKIVLCDRYLDSTLAYQGYGNGVDLKIIKAVGDFVTHGLIPDLTFVLDLEAKKGLGRIKRAKDRIELRALSYHERVRQGYLAIAKKEPRRVKIVPVDRDPAMIHEDVKRYLDILLKER
jgi:dTMP kinase